MKRAAWVARDEAEHQNSFDGTLFRLLGDEMMGQLPLTCPAAQYEVEKDASDAEDSACHLEIGHFKRVEAEHIDFAIDREIEVQHEAILEFIVIW